MYTQKIHIHCIWTERRQKHASVLGNFKLRVADSSDRKTEEEQKKRTEADREDGKCMDAYLALLKTSISSRSWLSFRDIEEVLAKTLRTMPDSAPMNTTV